MSLVVDLFQRLLKIQVRNLLPLRIKPSIGAIVVAILLLPGCTIARLELDKMSGASFPPNSISQPGMDPMSIPNLYATGERGVEVNQDDAAIPAIFPPGHCITNGEIESLVLTYRDHPASPSMGSCFLGFDCTIHHVYGAIVIYDYGASTGLCQDEAGYMLDPDNRGVFLLFAPVLELNDEELLTVTSHELGHTFNLHHSDRDGNSLMHPFSSGSDFVFSAASLAHLQNHPDDMVWPNTGPFDVYTAQHAAGHAAQATGNGATTQELELSLSSIETDLELGEPVYIVATLENKGSNPVEIVPWFGPEYDTLQFEITGPDGTRTNYLPYVYLDSLQPAVELEPGQALTTDVPIFFGGRGWTFDQAGAYSVQARYVDPLGLLHSVSEEYQLRFSDGANASRLLLDGGEAGLQAGKYLVWLGGDHLNQGIAALREVIDSHPDSALAAHARAALGINLSRDVMDFSLGEIRRADCREALAYLEAVDMERLPATLRVSTLLAQANCTDFDALDDDRRRLVELAEQHIGERADLRHLFEGLVELYDLPR
jgi:hypothetical protein